MSHINPDTLPHHTPKPRFHVDDKGVYHIGIKTDKDGNTHEQAPVHLADCLDLIGNGFNEAGEAFRIVRYTSKQTRQKAVFALPCADIGYNWQRLQGKGITVYAGRHKRELLADYLQTQGSFETWRVTDRAGWHGKAYILPNGEVLHHDDADTSQAPRIIYHGDTSQAHAYTASGGLQDWQEHIACYAAGNSRLCLALGVAFAAPLLSLLGEESGGFHLYGDSSDGKTTAACVALSVWGKPSESIMTWQGTALGFNNTATARNDGLLVLDEIGQAAPPVIGKTVYSIMNGINKVQGAKEGGNRALSRWRVLVLSTGEKTPQHILQHSRDWHAGQAARLPAIPAAAQYGIYDTLHGFTDGAWLSEHLKAAAECHHGQAGRAFIGQIDDHTPAHARAHIDAFMANLTHLSGQARRVAHRFALCAAALELAAPITGLAAGVGMAGIKQCFAQWYARHGSGKYEDEQIIKQATDFFGLYANSHRFAYWPLPANELTSDNPAGYVTHNAAGNKEWLFIPAVFEREICGEYEPNKACMVLYRIGWLNKPKSGGWKVQKTQGNSRPRFFSFNGITPPETAEQQEMD